MDKLIKILDIKIFIDIENISVEARLVIYLFVLLVSFFFIIF